METCQNRRFCQKIECLPLWPTYKGEKGRPSRAKHMGLMRGAIGNTLEEHIGNLGKILRTLWELEGNMLGTKGKKFKSPAPKL
jgi:hypothetical protein